MTRILPLLAVLLGLPLVGFLLTFSESAIEREDFVYAMLSSPETLDPALMTGVPEGRVAGALYEGLTSYHPRTLAPLPGVAERWEVLNGQLTYRFHLRQDAVWTSIREGGDAPVGAGDPVTAHDFVYAWNRVVAPETAAEYAYLMYYLRNAENIHLHQAWIRHLQAMRQGNLVLLELSALSRSDPAAGREHPLVELPEETPPEEESAALNQVAATRLGVLQHRGVVEDYQQSEGGFRVTLPPVDLTERFLHLGVRAVEDHLLEVQLESLTPFFLDLTSFTTYLPVNRRTVEAYGESWTRPKHIVTNGSFRLKQYHFQKNMVLERSPVYWDVGNVASQRIGIRFIESTNTQINMYLQGQLDWVDSVPPPLIDAFLERDDLMRKPYLGTYFFRLNTTEEPFKGERGRLVRRAISLAIDRTQIVEHIMRGGQLPAHHFVPVDKDGGSAIAGYAPPPSPIRFDPEEARRLLQAAGYPDPAEIPELVLLYNTHEAHKKIAANVQYQLQQNLGLRVSLSNMEWKTYLEAQRKLEYNICRAAWIGDYVDPNTFLDMFVTGGGNNNTGWSHPEYDLLINRYARATWQMLADGEARAELVAAVPAVAPLAERWDGADEAEQLELGRAARFLVFKQAERLLLEESPIIPIYFYVTLNVFNPETTEGIYGNARNIVPFKHVRVKER